MVVRCSYACDTYRLSDIVTGYYQKQLRLSNATDHVCSKWPHSLACAYLHHNTLCDVVAQSVVPTPNDTLAVHLRLGDVLDWPHYVHLRKCSPHTGCYYVYPVEYYRTVFVAPHIRHILLFGDPFFRYSPRFGSNASLHYRSAVADIFKKRGYQTQVHRSRDADQDFLQMVHAPNFLPGKGGYSALVVRMRRACRSH